MTQITDATVEQVLTWLAKQPCPETSVAYHSSGCKICEGADLKPTGLAYPRASEECPCVHAYLAKCVPCFTVLGHSVKCEDCNGSGRVPKALGLEELQDYLFTLGHIKIEYENIKGGVLCRVSKGEHVHYASYRFVEIARGFGETPTLAALRAVAKWAGIRQEGL